MSDKKPRLIILFTNLFIAARWSPYAFSNRPVTEDDLRSLFEAVRWTLPSYK